MSFPTSLKKLLALGASAAIGGLLTLALFGFDLVDPVTEFITGATPNWLTPIAKWLIPFALFAANSALAYSAGYTFRLRLLHRKAGEAAELVRDGRVPIKTLEELILAFQRNEDAAKQAAEIFGVVVDLAAREGEEPGEMPNGTGDLIKYLVDVLKIATVPSVLQPYFRKRAEALAFEIRDLAAGSRLNLPNKRSQFALAGNVAYSFIGRAKNKASPTLVSVYATSLDRPSEFKRKYGSGYFFRLEELQTAMKPVHELSEEDHKLLPQHFKENGVAEERDRGIEELRWFVEEPAESDPPRRPEHVLKARSARLCVLPSSLFHKEIVSAASGPANRGLADFVMWHWTNGFAIRFLVLEEFADSLETAQEASTDEEALSASDGKHNYSQEQLLWQRYEERLSGMTAEAFDESIDDFIVYNNEVVFGRTTAEPSRDGNVPVRLIAPTSQDREDLKELPSRYREFFIEAWKESKTLVEIFQEVLTKQPDCKDACLTVAEQVLTRIEEESAEYVGP